MWITPDDPGGEPIRMEMGTQFSVCPTGFGGATLNWQLRDPDGEAAEYVLEIRVDGQELAYAVTIEDSSDSRLLIQPEDGGVWSIWVIEPEPRSSAWIHFYASIYDEATGFDLCEPQGSWPVKMRRDGVGLLRIEPDGDDPRAVYYVFTTEPDAPSFCDELAFTLL